MNARHLIPAAAALLLLAACTHELKTARVSDERFVPLKEGSEIGFTADYDMEYVTGGVPKDVMDKINCTLITEELYEPEGTDVPAACKNWLEISCAGYQDDAETMMEDMDIDPEDAGWMLNWSSSVSGAFTGSCKARGWQSYCCASSDYQGGAHGMYGETHRVFDLATGEQVQESDFLREGADEDEDLAELLYGKLMAGLDEEEEDALFGIPGPNENFSVSDEGVTWHYNPYEIAPYAFGVLEATLTWEELKPFLK